MTTEFIQYIIQVTSLSYTDFFSICKIWSLVLLYLKQNSLINILLIVRRYIKNHCIEWLSNIICTALALWSLQIPVTMWSLLYCTGYPRIPLPANIWFFRIVYCLPPDVDIRGCRECTERKQPSSLVFVSYLVPFSLYVMFVFTDQTYKNVKFYFIL